MKKMFICNKILFFSLFFVFSSILTTFFTNHQAVAVDDYNTFTKSVIRDFTNQNKNMKVLKNRTISKTKSGKVFDFVSTLVENYNNFANDRYKNNDYIDAYYFKRKASKIKNYKIISPANPYSFGIIPDDLQQFILAREQIKNVSINSLLNSNDGVVLADSYIAYDCWLEAFEEGNAVNRMKRCRNRLFDNLKAMRLSLLAQGYHVFDMSTKEDLLFNNRLSTCESCDLFNKGLYCNALYFKPEEATFIEKMNIVVKRLQRKVSIFNTATIQIMYYQNAYGYDAKLSVARLSAVKNLLYNTILTGSPITPNVKMVAITLSNEEQQQKIFRDAITICISGNE